MVTNTYANVQILNTLYFQAMHLLLVTLQCSTESFHSLFLIRCSMQGNATPSSYSHDRKKKDYSKVSQLNNQRGVSVLCSWGQPHTIHLLSGTIGSSIAVIKGATPRPPALVTATSGPPVSVIVIVTGGAVQVSPFLGFHLVWCCKNCKICRWKRCPTFSPFEVEAMCLVLISNHAQSWFDFMKGQVRGCSVPLVLCCFSHWTQINATLGAL